LKKHAEHLLNTFQIHLSGIVQGVGFRPFVYNLALKHGYKGWVCNTSSGVYIRLNTNEKNATEFLNELINNAPQKAIIRRYSLEKIKVESFSSFLIKKSFMGEEEDRMITPDYAMCDACRAELNDKRNKRYHYAFTTCSECGPRYSIINTLPYDRESTTMNAFTMCKSCEQEYNDPNDRRFYSQTNSCPKCGVKMSLYSYSEGDISGDQFQLIHYCSEAIKKGSIICLKGIGGYMLLADARNKNAVLELRKRKNRPDKPFALMVKDLNMAKKLAYITPEEEASFLSDAAPILLVKKKEDQLIAFDQIAPQLGEIGIMRPYTPLHQLLLDQLNFPIIASSGNLSGSPIIYSDENIIEEMRGIADQILIHNRKINTAQDDSVLRIAKNNQKIIIRRSRGLAPNVSDTETNNSSSILALGAMLKSTIALLYKGNTFVSQYIGNSNTYETQVSYANTLKKLSESLDFKPEILLSDMHPGYFTSELADEMAALKAISNIKIQHHEAHFAACLGEHDLWNNKVLGIVWDGTGLGKDGNIWGGEFFEYENGALSRSTHLPYQHHILGDKMVNEPRISALSLFSTLAKAKPLLKEKFTAQEWKLYTKKIDSSTLLTSSMGRLFDAVSSLLNLNNISSFHGQAAMLLEAKALEDPKRHVQLPYRFLDDKGDFSLSILLKEILEDVLKKEANPIIASRFHHSLVAYIKKMAVQLNQKTLCFSGGVFQNKFLVELVAEKLSNDYNLFFHTQFSPNDESISFGQLMHYLHIKD